jgi:hypothetical protein
MIRYSWSIFFLPIPLAMVSKLASIGSRFPGSKEKIEVGDRLVVNGPLLILMDLFREKRDG